VQRAGMGYYDARRARAQEVLESLRELAEKRNGELGREACALKRPAFFLRMVGVNFGYIEEYTKINAEWMRLRAFEQSLDKLLELFARGWPADFLRPEIREMLRWLEKRAKTTGADGIDAPAIAHLRRARALLESRMYSGYEQYCELISHSPPAEPPNH
jgi:hypothetical protein